ncbi:MAG: hypothetical protein PVH18_12555, partial [Chloroflexota bacterium]
CLRQPNAWSGSLFGPQAAHLGALAGRGSKAGQMALVSLAAQSHLQPVTDREAASFIARQLLTTKRLPFLPQPQNSRLHY